MAEFVHQPAESNRLGDFLLANLKKPWPSFRAAIAFVKRSGTRHLRGALTNFAQTRDVELVVGIDMLGTSKEGLDDLLGCVSPKGRVIVFHNEIPRTFHPKLFVFKSKTEAAILVGSGNLTEGGLFTNYEAGLKLDLDLRKDEDKRLLRSVETIIDTWGDTSKGTARVLDEGLLLQLVANGYVPLEALSEPASGEERHTPTRAPKAGGRDVKLFASVPVSRAPHASGEPRMRTRERRVGAVLAGTSRGFVITLQQTDVGRGQVTPGTSARSPELFIPVICVQTDPAFWGWPDLFAPDPNWKGPQDKDGYGKMDRTGVRMRLASKTLSVNWWYNPDKKDFRLRHSELRSAGNVGDILRIEIAPPGADFEYYVEPVPQGTTQFPVYSALCTQPVRNSRKRFGYY